MDKIKLVDDERLDIPDVYAIADLTYEYVQRVLGGLLGSARGVLDYVNLTVVDAAAGTWTVSDFQAYQGHVDGDDNDGALNNSLRTAKGRVFNFHRDYSGNTGVTGAGVINLQAHQGVPCTIWCQPIDDVDFDLDTRRKWDVASGDEVTFAAHTRRRTRVQFAVTADSSGNMSPPAGWTNPVPIINIYSWSSTTPQYRQFPVWDWSSVSGGANKPLPETTDGADYADSSGSGAGHLVEMLRKMRATISDIMWKAPGSAYVGGNWTVGPPNVKDGQGVLRAASVEYLAERVADLETQVTQLNSVVSWQNDQTKLQPIASFQLHIDTGDETATLVKWSAGVAASGSLGTPVVASQVGISDQLGIGNLPGLLNTDASRTSMGVSGAFIPWATLSSENASYGSRPARIGDSPAYLTTSMLSVRLDPTVLKGAYIDYVVAEPHGPVGLDHPGAPHGNAHGPMVKVWGFWAGQYHAAARIGNPRDWVTQGGICPFGKYSDYNWVHLAFGHPTVIHADSTMSDDRQEYQFRQGTYLPIDPLKHQWYAGEQDDDDSPSTEAAKCTGKFVVSVHCYGRPQRTTDTATPVWSDVIANSKPLPLKAPDGTETS